MSDFTPEPRNMAEYVKAIWHDMKEVKSEVRRTNGRVTRLERAAILAGGVAIGFGLLNLSTVLSLL